MFIFLGGLHFMSTINEILFLLALFLQGGNIKKISRRDFYPMMVSEFNPTEQRCAALD